MSNVVGDLLLWLVAWRIGWRLHHRSLEDVARELGRQPISGLREPPTGARELAARADRMVTRWTVPLAGPCLIRSLLVYSLLGGRGSGLELVLGFAPDDRAVGLRGHAWLRQDGAPLRPEDADASRVYPHTVVLT